MLAVSFAVPLIIFGQRFIGLWVGADFAWTWRILAIVLFGEVFRFAQFPGIHILTATKNILPVSLIQIFQAAFLVILMIALVVKTDLGLIGIALAMAVSNIIFKAVVLPIYTCRQLGLKAFRYWFSSHAPTIFMGVILCVFCALFSLYYAPANIFMAALQLGLSIAVGLGLGAFLVMDSRDRRQIFQLLK